MQQKSSYFALIQQKAAAASPGQLPRHGLCKITVTKQSVMNLQQSMNKNKSKEEQGPPPTSYKFYLGSRQRYIHIDCNFQSGNIQLVRQMSEFNYRLSCIDDGLKTGHRVNSKSWFYFRVYGFPKHTKGKFAVSRLQTLMAVYNQHPKTYRPVYRDCNLEQGQWSDWTRITTESPLILRQSSELQCVFEFPFRNEQHCVEFAFAYPYTYSRNIEYLNGLNQYYCNDDFYFHKEVLTRSPEGRDVHLVTITSHDMVDQDAEEEELFNAELFPENCRPKRFKKPVVFISARVHPGQTAASFTMEGIIDFLVNNADLRSYLLKKMFVFMIVPMINVDGVFHGHFRMDNFGKNLNRYYVDPNNGKQPAIYAIKELANYLIKDNRLSFYFDLHAHNAKKGAFIYGNAINDFVEQVESQVYCKLFAMNHSGFQYEYCNFSLKQMNSKDRNEERTKQGCGRVVMHRIAHIIHSYSLECGIISANKHSIVPHTPNEEFTLADRGIAPPNHSKQQGEPHYFTQESYRELGRSLLISILDVFDKNPYNRVYNSSQKSMQFLRRVTAFEVFHTAERFRMFEKYVYGKVKNINELIRQVLNSKLHYRELYNFYFYNDKDLKNVQWPENIPGLVKPKFTHKLKRFHSLQQPKLQYSLSFLQDLKANRDQLQTFQNQQQIEPPQLTLGDEDSLSSETEGENEKQSISTEFMKNVIENQIHSQIISCQKYRQSQPISRWNVQEDEDDSPWLIGQQKEICQSERSYQQENCYPKSEKLIARQTSQNTQKERVSQIIILDKAEHFECEGIKLPQNESPSVRVRRLLKNEGASKKLKMSTQEMKDRLNEMISNSPIITHNADYSRSIVQPQSTFLNSNTLSNYSGVSAKSEAPYHDRQMKLFEEIKMEIKQELRRHKQKNGIMCTVSRPSKPIKYSVSEVKPKDRIRSTNLNSLNINLHSHNGTHKQKSQTVARVPSRSSIGKTQLPALNSHILIITSNSSKGLFNNS